MISKLFLVETREENKSLEISQIEEIQTERSTGSPVKKFYSWGDQKRIETENSQKLFKAIESLLWDENIKVRLSAAIAVFRILNRFRKPITQEFATAFANSEKVLRQNLKSIYDVDRYTAAQCLGMHGYFDQEIVKILLETYFESQDQVTRVHVISILSQLSSDSVGFCSSS